MKIFLILLTLVLISCRTQNSLQKIDYSPNPVTEISPISNQAAESNHFPAKEVVTVSKGKIFAFPTPDEISTEDFLRKENTVRLKKFGLYDLEKQQIPKDDLEIRVWQINDLYMRIYKDLAVKESVFILKRTNGKWFAKVFRNTVNQKSDVEKLINTKLDAPKSGWENFWQTLVDSELLVFPDWISGKVEFEVDAGICIIETNVDGLFKTYQYAGNREMREIRHTAKILNTIADEFVLEDFQAIRKYE